jgi:hypothetical protein
MNEAGWPSGILGRDGAVAGICSTGQTSLAARGLDGTDRSAGALALTLTYVKAREWAELIVKLRWIGLENEARHLAASSKRTSAGRERYCRGWTFQHGLVALAA